MILKGEKIYLKEGLSEKNYPLILQWFNDLEVVQYFSFAQKALALKNIEELKMLIAEIETGPIFEIYNLEDKFLGYTSLSEMRGDQEREFTVFILDKNYWGKGMAKEATSLTLKYAFNNLGAKKITLDTSEHHARAIGFYKKMGFVQSALIPNDRTIYLNGNWTLSDTMQMEIIRDQYFDIKIKKLNG
jgi:RimJ/RimL family protein N-acetyltransferase